MFSSRNFRDLQDASAGQLSDTAIQQLNHRFSLVPRFFTEIWEYNWMEGGAPRQRGQAPPPYPAKFDPVCMHF